MSVSETEDSPSFETEFNTTNYTPFHWWLLALGPAQDEGGWFPDLGIGLYFPSLDFSFVLMLLFTLYAV